jgi:hypothetical protein
MWVMCNLSSFHLETVLVSMQDRCMVCARHTIDLEVILDTPDGTTRWWGPNGCSFWSFSEIVLILMQDRCTVCVKHTIGSKIILDTHDGTPMWHWSCGISLLPIWRQIQCLCKIGAQFAPNVPSAYKSFWTHLMVPRGDKAQVKLGHLEIVLILTQD